MVKNNKYAWKIFCCLIILIEIVRYWHCYYAPQIIGDEFGYWSTAEWIVGTDWHELANLNGYYGFGYGLILAILVCLPFKASIIYKIAIILNILMLFLIFLMAYLFTKKNFANKKLSEFVICCIALFGTIGTSTLYYAHFSMCEVFLTLLFWIEVSIIYSLLNQNSWWKMLLLALIGGFMVWVHLRMISIWLITIIFLLLLIKKNSTKNNLVLIGSCILSFIIVILGLWIKNRYQDAMSATNMVDISVSSAVHQVSANANDESSVIALIKNLASIDGLRNFVIVFMGRIFYLIISTMGLFLFFLPQAITSIKELLIKKRLTIHIYILGCLIIALIMSALANTWGYKERFDFLVYGRYHELVMGPIIILAIFSLFSLTKCDLRKLCFGGAMMVLVIAKIVNANQIYTGETGNAISHSMWLFFWMNIFHQKKDTLLIVGIIIAAILFILGYLGTYRIRKFCLIILLGFSLWSMDYSYNQSFAGPFGRHLEEKILFEKKYADVDLTFFYLNDISHLNVVRYQYLLKGNSIHLIYSYKDYLENMNENTRLITRQQLKSQLDDFLEVDFDGGKMADVIVWK